MHIYAYMCTYVPYAASPCPVVCNPLSCSKQLFVSWWGCLPVTLWKFRVQYAWVRQLMKNETQPLTNNNNLLLVVSTLGLVETYNNGTLAVQEPTIPNKYTLQ